jgi:signal transduction histidine kinase
MQDKLIRLVSVLFFGLVIFLVFGFIGMKTGSSGTTFWLGLILFLLVVAAQFTSRMGKASGKSQSQAVRDFYKLNRNAMVGGLILFAVLLGIAYTIMMAMKV